MIKIFLFKVFFLIFFSIFSLKSFAEEKIAFIDVNYLFNVSLIGKDISNNINKLNQNLNIEATEFQKSIEIDKKPDIVDNITLDHDKTANDLIEFV